MSKKIKLGIIGLSKGNGHPYSWSAIINGYDKKLMRKCEFPAIPKYLEKRNFPKDQIKRAEVTHIWTQSSRISNKIANATFIKSVVKDYKDLLGKIDGILLARDDADLHLKYAKPFLKNGLPIYIDKPLAFTIKEAKKIISLQKYDGQIFSCSSNRYAKEFKLNEKQKKKIGKIRSIQAFVPKDWDKYAVHAIDPLIRIIPNRGPILESKRIGNKYQSTLNVKYKNNLILSIFSSGQPYPPLSIRITGTNGCLDLFADDAFQCFKSALNDFISSIKYKENKISIKEMLEIIKLIELGR